jgi:hypothetical protein
MSERTCLGCGAPLKPSDIACPSCGRVHLYARNPWWPPKGDASFRQMLVWAGLVLAVISAVAWRVVSLSPSRVGTIS